MQKFIRPVNKTRDLLINQSEKTGSSLSRLFTDVGNATLFGLRFFKELFKLPYEFKEIINQCYDIGNRSLGLVSITGFIMGLVLTIQSRPTLADFGAESWLPGMVAISLVREIGPVITALICAGKIASGIGAELGSMKVTEQIDAMEVSGTNPYKYLVFTRIFATTLMIPILVFFADFIGLIGAFAGVNIKGHVSLFLFFSQAFANLEFLDILPATIKTFVFGFMIGFVGCYKGYNASMGTASVGKAANSAVVVASLMIFIVDMVAVQITDLLLPS